ncbi:MAG TPA: protein-L-isoaspartate(D-aspartate) O-methyltransferase [Casimicrobiaceae bacterium]|jgi:protein-L-isoaspartate(D-aspartate) O-methyltransferase
MGKTKVRIALAALLAPLVAPFHATPASDDDFSRERQRMVTEIAAMAKSTKRETGRERFAEPVMEAMANVPRHRFVPETAVRSAYRNEPLSIGEGQTISQPYIVALSTDLIDPRPEHVVLEIGTGSGYQAAVLSELVKEVYSIEIVEPLGRSAAERLKALGYRKVEVRIGDGYQGWPERAPFDGIVVTAAAPFIPEPLLEQLKVGGKMVIPVEAGPRGQQMLLVEKRADGTIEKRVVLHVAFVPMTGKGIQDRKR